MKWLHLFLLASCSLHCGSPQTVTEPAKPKAIAPDLEIDDRLSPTALTQAGNVLVELVPLRVPEGEAPQALFRVTGINHPLAGVTLRATRHDAMTVTWSATLDGDSYALLATRHNEERTFLQLPLLDRSVILTADAQAASKIRAEELLDDHRAHLKDGSIARLERLDREWHIAAHARRLKSPIKRVEQACGLTLDFPVDWSSVPDAAAKKSSHCAGSLAAVATVCERDKSSRRSLSSRVEKIECSFDERTRLWIGEDKVLRTTAPESSSHYSKQGALEELYYRELHRMFELTDSVLALGQDQVFVFDPDRENPKVFLGDRETLFEQYVRNREPDLMELWNGGESAKVRRSKSGDWSVKCGETITALTEVDDALRNEILSTAKREGRKWKRKEFALARDDRGTYYYVDHFNEDNGSKGFRVFKGRRGALVLTKLIDIVDDSDGMIFATSSGKLRLLLGKKDGSQATWIEGRRQRRLVFLPLFENRNLIYRELGVYADADLGTVCGL